MTTCELLGVNKVGGGGADADSDLLALLSGRDPPLMINIEV
eukprot:CAMPEP_0115671774 /NCGR_PEP_ID=MMETSP0272-20121206/52229_1 /TAXON_ID=71861 /ORGANISM="Scrippsiella trochoidea, Strain CCMP3099" /LENGTH=40 /DNA_ID= /DNA_START= /DNA_END= /DNA_ORIENTATION=